MTGRAVVLTLLISATASAQAPSASDVLAKVQKFYAGQQQLTAMFQQVVTQAAFGTTATTNGSVRVEKPSLFRFDYRANNNIATKSFIFDGTILWIIDVPNKQIIENQVAPNATLPAAVSFLTGATNLATQFDVAINTTGKFGGTKATVLELTPKQPSAQLKQLVFVVDPTTPNFAAAIKPSLFQVNPKTLPSFKLVVVPPSATTPTPKHP